MILLVTGGGRGIGAATARIAAERGYDVCVNYRANSDAAGRVVAVAREHDRRPGSLVATHAAFRDGSWSVQPGIDCPAGPTAVSVVNSEIDAPAVIGCDGPLVLRGNQFAVCAAELF